MVKRWFDDTLPSHADAIPQIPILHADGDWYDSVRLTLDSLYDKVSPGGFVVVDDYSVWSGARQAVDDFRRERRIEAPAHSSGGLRLLAETEFSRRRLS